MTKLPLIWIQLGKALFYATAVVVLIISLVIIICG